MSEVNNAAPVSDAAPAQAEAQGDTAQTQENQQAQAQAQAQKNLKKLKLKVDGQEIEEEIDLNDEQRLVRELQLAKAAQKRMSEAAKARKEAEQIVGMFKGNIKDVMKHADKLGKRPEQIRAELEEYFAEILQEEMLTPEQRKVRDAERILREREEEQKARAKAEEEQRMAQLRDHYAGEYDKQITQALQSSGLPKTPKTVRRMAELMSKNLSMGLELEPSQVVELVREDYLNEIKELFGASDGDTLLKLLGDDVANKIRKSDLARLKSQGLTPRKPAETPQPQSKPQKRMSTEEWLAERRRQILKGG